MPIVSNVGILADDAITLVFGHRLPRLLERETTHGYITPRIRIIVPYARGKSRHCQHLQGIPVNKLFELSGTSATMAATASPM